MTITNGRPRRRLKSMAVALVAVSVAVLLGTVTQAAPASAAGWTAPGLVRSISGTGRPGVFPWGIHYNPVSDEIVVADYLNYQIRRYSRAGELLGSFYRSGSTGQPYSIAIDPRNGDIYTPEIADGKPSNKVAHYTKDGTFVSELTLTGIDYEAWIAIDARGNLWQSDSHYMNNGTTNPPVIRKWRLSDGVQTASWDVVPAGVPTPRMYGIDVDRAGNVWASDTVNKAVYKWNGTGTLLATYTDTEHLGGDVRGMTVDTAHGWYYVSDASNDEVEKYALDGRWLRTLGGDGADGESGSDLGELGAPRQLTIDSDGRLYVAEYGNKRVSVFGTDGLAESFFPDPAQPAPAGQLGQPRDVDVNSSNGNVWVADSWNQRVQEFSATGAFLGVWGSRGSNPPYGMNYPRGIAVEPVSHDVWVVNQRGHHIKRYTSDMTYIDTLGSEKSDSSAPGSFAWPLDVEFNAGLAYVSDRRSGVIKVLDAATGDPVRQWTRNNHGLAVDPASGNVYVTDPATNRVYVYSSTGTELSSFGSTGTGDGQFQHAWDAVVSGGLLYVTDDKQSRISVFSLDGTWLGSFGNYGVGAYQFRNPSGIAADAQGRIYVTDTTNDRIQVYDPATTRPAPVRAPVTTLTGPSDGARIPAAPVSVTGTVTDDTGVAGVQVAVQDVASGEWFDASNSTWQATRSWTNAPYVSSVPTRATFSWTFVGEQVGHSYRVSARAVDVAAATGTASTRSFSVIGRAGDAPPETTISSPLPGAALPAGPAVPITGFATDDLGVASVQVAISRPNGEYWQPGGGWGPEAWLAAQVAAPGATATGWSYAWPAPGAGAYTVTARTRDSTGHLDTTQPTVSFTVVAPDTVVPNGTVTSPRAGATVPAGTVAITGTATDDVGVASVQLLIRRTGADPAQWWDGAGWSMTPTSLPAVLADPGATSTTWVYLFAAPSGAGELTVNVATTDAAGNVDPTRPKIPFVVGA